MCALDHFHPCPWDCLSNGIDDLDSFIYIETFPSFSWGCPLWDEGWCVRKQVAYHLSFTIRMRPILLIKTRMVGLLVFFNVLSLQWIFCWCRLISLGLQGSECVIWAKAFQSEHNLSRIVWVAENTLNLQLLEKVLKYYLCNIGQCFKP